MTPQQSLANAIRDKAETHIDTDVDTCELLRVLARVVEGRSLAQSFGAPGDWGYGTPIGDAIAKGGARS